MNHFFTFCLSLLLLSLLVAGQAFGAAATIKRQVLAIHEGQPNTHLDWVFNEDQLVGHFETCVKYDCAILNLAHPSLSLSEVPEFLNRIHGNSQEYSQSTYLQSFRAPVVGPSSMWSTRVLGALSVMGMGHESYKFLTKKKFSPYLASSYALLWLATYMLWRFDRDATAQIASTTDEIETLMLDQVSDLKPVALKRSAYAKLIEAIAFAL